MFWDKLKILNGFLKSVGYKYITQYKDYIIWPPWCTRHNKQIQHVTLVSIFARTGSRFFYFPIFPIIRNKLKINLNPDSADSLLPYVQSILFSGQVFPFKVWFLFKVNISVKHVANAAWPRIGWTHCHIKARPFLPTRI